MAKLVAFALAFTALVAFASAHSTIVTTTIEEENPVSRQQCGRQVQGESINQCQRYLQQSQGWNEEDNRGQMQGGLQSCCQELQYVDEQCQCEAVKEAFRQAQSMQQQQQQRRQQGGSFGSQQVRQMRQKAQNLPNQCNLRTRQCQIGTVFITSTTTISDENTRGSRSMQQCQDVRGRQFDECQYYIRQQSRSGTLLMSINRQFQQEGLRQCCNELQNVEQECQCEAMQEVYRQAQQMQYQQGSQQRGRRGGQMHTQDLQQIVQNLRNQCMLQVQQCRVPSAMF